MISNHSVMWGDPPKPNVWQIKHTPSDPLRGLSEKWVVHSPLLRDCFVIYKRRPSGDFHVFYGTGREVLGNDGDWDLEYILSNKWYMEYLKPLLESGHIRMRDYNIKLASGAENVEVMWGDPPKPNIWGIRSIIPNGNLVEISSPFMVGVIEVYTSLRSSSGTYYPDEGSARSKSLLFSGIEKDMDYILSSEGYKNPIKNHIDEGVIKIKKGFKVASSEIKLQWGDPPKPNLWKVEQINNSTVSRQTYLITSPLFKRTVDGDRFALRVQIDSWAKEAIVNLYYQYNDRVGMPLGIFQLSEEWFYKVDDLLAHSSTWRRAIKPALARADESILTSKVASSSDWFPNTVTSSPKVKLNWGSPAKPNIWRGWRGDSGDAFFYYVESPLLTDTCIEVHLDRRSSVAEVFIYDGVEKSFMRKVSHITLGKSLSALELDEEVRSEEFWKSIVSPKLREHGHLNKVRIASRI